MRRAKRSFKVTIGKLSAIFESRSPGGAARQAFKSAIKERVIKRQPETSEGGWKGVSIAAICLLLFCSTAYGQVVVPADIKPPAPFVATLTLPAAEGTTNVVEWASDDGTGFIKVSDTLLHVGAFPGKHWLQATVKTEISGSKVVLVPGPKWPDVPTDITKETLTYLIDRKEAVHRTDFEVEGEPPPPPPAPKPLAVLAGSNAPALGTMYAGLAKQCDSITTAANFRAVHKKLLTDSILSQNGAAAEIDKRLAVVLVDPLDHAKLKSVLEEFVAELGSLPPPPVTTTTAQSATYVYEKSGGPVPSSVMVGINRLNRERNIVANIFDQDTTDGDGQVPDQYKVAMEAAKVSGLPAFVVTAGDKVLAVIKAPTTEAQIWEAVP